MEKKIEADFENTFKNSLVDNEVKLKKELLNKFIKKGFPSKKLESWKFSDLNQIINSNIEKLSFYNNSKTTKIDESVYLKNIEHNKMVFVNGRCEEISLEYEHKNKFKIQEEKKNRK